MDWAILILHGPTWAILKKKNIASALLADQDIQRLASYQDGKCKRLVEIFIY